MKTRFSPAHLLVVLALLFVVPATSFAAEGDTGTLDTETAPLTLTPAEVEALENPNDAPNSENSSFVDDSGDFISDNAAFFIIGIVIIAAIIAGILIMRGRRSTGRQSPASTSSSEPGAPAAVPSATEIRRRKRAAMQAHRDKGSTLDGLVKRQELTPCFAG